MWEKNSLPEEVALSMLKQVRKLFRWLPVSWKSRIDFVLNKSLGKEFGGPFNGQIFRQNIFKDLIKAFPLNAIVETGTFRGVTTKFMAAESALSVYTVEAVPRFFHYAKQNLQKSKKTQVFLGDSRQFIEQLSQDKIIPKQNVFFYLDAHWNDDLPLFKEIELIDKTWSNTIVMIDDFKVPDDIGYQYDNYGEGKQLDLEYILPLVKVKWSVFFPFASSQEESGLKRGCIILASKELELEMKNIRSLRIYDTLKNIASR